MSFFSKIGKRLANAANDIASYEEKQLAAQVAKSKGAKAPVAPSLSSDPVLETLLRNVRSKHVRQHFFSSHPAVEYTEQHGVSLLVGSFNVNAHKPPPGLRIGDWLGAALEAPPARAGPADILAVGFQEIVSLTAGNVMGVSGTQNVVAWDRCLAAYLNGEDWAREQYGASTSAGAAPAEAVESSAMEVKWMGGDAPAFEPAVMPTEPVPPDAKLDTGDVDPQQPKQHYVQVASKQLVGVYLSVWVRKELLPNVRGVQVTSCATGFGGYLGNKGAVAVRLRVYDSALCVVVAHLAAGEAEGDELRRNTDVAQILARCVFSPEQQDQAPMLPSGAALVSSALAPGHWGAARLLTDHENLIFTGDLNYRLNMADDEVRKAIRTAQWPALSSADQLVREMAGGRVFKGWREAPLNFMPTFKYKIGTNQYVGDPALARTNSKADRVGGVDDESGAGTPDDSAADDEGADIVRSSGGGGGSRVREPQTKRAPAWCDRLLWVPAPTLEFKAYGRGELNSSDHKPVFASFSLTARHYDRAKIEALLDQSLKAVDAMQLALRPRPRLDTNVLQAGRVRFGDVQRFTVTLSNSGAVEGLFHFIPPPTPKGNRYVMEDDAPIAPPWLKAEPEEGIVPAGGTQPIVLTVALRGGPGGAAAHLAASPNDFLDAILILRVEDGADMFLSVTGEHVRSCLGISLDRMLAYGDRPIAAEAQDGGPGASSSGAGGAGDSAAAVADRLTAVQLGGGAGGTAGASAAAAAAPADAAGAREVERVPSFGRVPSASAAAAAASSAAWELVPKEVKRIVTFLRTEACLRTPGFFHQSLQHVLGESLALTSSETLLAAGRNSRAELVVRLAPLWQALDAGRGLPERTSPHEAAALLLTLCGELPRLLLPPPAAATAVACAAAPLAAGSGAASAGQAAARVLARVLTAVEWAVLWCFLGMFKKAVAEAESNGLTLVNLANCLVDFWSGPAVAMEAGVGAAVAPLPGGQALAPQAQARSHCVALIMLLLNT